jgi:hypothetical protein
MGHECVVYGYIYGTPWKPEEYRKLQELNCEVLDSLPESDEWPFLTRSMFSVPGWRAQEGTYQGQIIHFGASLKELEYDWPQWLAKFENLLSKLFWNSAIVHLESEFGGTHACSWLAEDVIYDPPQPTVRWTFEGPREFDLRTLKPA